MNKPLRGAVLLALNLLILGAFVWAVQRNGGWSALLAPWQRIPLLWLALASLAQIGSYGLRALRIYIAEAAIPRGRFIDCLRLICINTAVNWLLPMRSGEASFPILMRRWFGVDAAHATGTLFWLRLLDLHVLATVGLLCLTGGWMASDTLTGLAWFGVAGAALAPPLAYTLRGVLARWLATHEGKLAKLVARLLMGLPSRVGTLLLDLLLSWAVWLLKLASLGLLLAQLAGLPRTLGILGAIGGDLSTVLPVHTPGGFGTYEAGVVGALKALQTPGEGLLHAAVDLHLFVLGLALAAGAVSALAGLRRAEPR